MFVITKHDEGVYMGNIKKELLKIGKEIPELREHITPILDHISGQKTSSRDIHKDFLENFDDILLRLGRIEDLLQQKQRKLMSQPSRIDWGDVGSLGHVVSKLDEIIRFLS